MVLLTLGASLLAAPAASADTLPTPAYKKEKEAAMAINAFAGDLYSKLHEQPGNLFFSPYSISTALAMTMDGARGSTAVEMATTLHLANDAAAKQSLAALYKRLNTPSDDFTLTTANRLWGMTGYPFQPAFLEDSKTYFGAGIQAVDFGNAQQSAATINAWVEDQTHHRITDLIPATVIIPQTRLILTNAIYFKAPWRSTFTAGATDKATFNVTPDKSTQVDMMHQQKQFAYAESSDPATPYQAVELGYSGSPLAMLIILPKAGHEAAVEAALSKDLLETLTPRLTGRAVDVSLPKFKIESQFSLADVLKQLGITKVFSAADADFSGISTAEGLYISKVIHKAYITVDEKGTEAAAATAIIMPNGSAMVRPEDLVTFTADHPFLFVIRDTQTGAVLFTGRVNNPS